jgi:hypothetical protein
VAGSSFCSCVPTQRHANDGDSPACPACGRAVSVRTAPIRSGATAPLRSSAIEADSSASHTIAVRSATRLLASKRKASLLCAKALFQLLNSVISGARVARTRPRTVPEVCERIAKCIAVQIPSAPPGSPRQPAIFFCATPASRRRKRRWGERRPRPRDGEPQGSTRRRSSGSRRSSPPTCTSFGIG